MTFQVSIFLENKLGHLEKVTAVLRDAGINIRSIHINHTASGWGILSLVVSRPEAAQEALSAQGITTALREIVVLRMADRPGGLDELLKDVVKAGVNFENAYGISLNDGSNALFVIDIQDMPGTRARLESVGLAIEPDPLVYGA